MFMLRRGSKMIWIGLSLLGGVVTENGMADNRVLKTVP